MSDTLSFHGYIGESRRCFLFASTSDDARLPFQKDDNSRVESFNIDPFSAINVYVISSELIVVSNFVCI